ncbi:MAG: hypothetical protein J6A28_00755 [Clostridia bacterium]|nr:hypothetical protein [Clostridia bacterium]
MQTNENIDKVLESVSDQVIRKKKFKRTLISSIILSAVVVIAAIFICLSTIKIDLHPQFLRGADAYNVNISGKVSYIDEQSAKYQEFLDEYNEVFQTTILGGLFSGRSQGYSIEESNTVFYSNSTNKTGMSSSLKSELGNNYIEFIFNDEQAVTNRDGSQYYSTYYKAGTYALRFEKCYLKLDSESSDTMTFYLGTYDTARATITKVIVKADSSIIYNYFA